MSIKDIVLIRLSSLNSVYKNDLVLFLSDLNSNETRIINSLIKNGLVLEREIDKENVYRSLTNKKVKIIEITNKGRVYLADKYHDEKYIEEGLKVASKYQTSNVEKLHKLLATNRVKIMFLKAGVLVFNKPSIDEFISNRFSNELEKGIYYSKEEFSEYVNREDKQAHDVYKSARFKGVFINQEQVALVYLSNVEKNRVIRLVKSSEFRATDLVKKTFCNFTNQHLPNAIVFSNTDSLMYNMAINGHNGHNAHDHPKQTGKYIFLDNHCPFFEHIFVFPHTYSGMDSLEKYCHNDYKKYKEESVMIFKSLENFKSLTSDNLQNFYGYNITNSEKAIYIPYYDIKQLWEIYKLGESVTIVTFDDMAEPISHAIRQPAHFFNVEGLPLEVNRYSSSGDIVGIEPPQPGEKKYKPRTVRRSFAIEQELYNELSHIADTSYISVNKLVRNILYEYIKKL